MISCWFSKISLSEGTPAPKERKKKNKGEQLQKERNKKGSVYLCPGCASLQGKKYAFGWSCNVPNGLVTQKRERNIDDTKALVQSDEATVAASLSSSSKRAKRDDNGNSSSFI